MQTTPTEFTGSQVQLHNKTPKRRVKAKLRGDLHVATQPNETWAMDFVHDQLTTGKKIRVLTVSAFFEALNEPVRRPATRRGHSTGIRQNRMRSGGAARRGAGRLARAGRFLAGRGAAPCRRRAASQGAFR